MTIDALTVPVLRSLNQIRISSTSRDSGTMGLMSDR